MPAATEDLIDTQEELASFLSGLGDPKSLVCAVDTEADSLHSYREKLCLIQFGCGDDLRLIDPLSIGDLAPLMDFLEGSEVWMHGADFDMSILKRTFGRVPERVYDTQVAARLLGYRRFGLAHLVEEHFNVKLSKQSQRANWGKRPLSDKLVEYALNDVRYIFPLCETLVSRLKELGRYEWFLESCESARSTVLDRPGKSEDVVWRIPGAGKLSRRGLAFVREIWRWRDREAERLDRPAFKVIGNEFMLKAAATCDGGGTVELPGRFPREVHERFRSALDRARGLGEDDWPEKSSGRRPERDPNFRSALEKLRRKRDKVAGKLDLDETLLAPKATLEKLISDPPLGRSMLLNWQRELLDLGE